MLSQVKIKMKKMINLLLKKIINSLKAILKTFKKNKVKCNSKKEKIKKFRKLNPVKTLQLYN